MVVAFSGRLLSLLVPVQRAAPTRSTTRVTQAFALAAAKAEEVLIAMSRPVDLSQRDQLIKAAQTSLASKVVSQNSEDLAPLAVDAVLAVTDGPTADNVDLGNVRVVKALGGTIDETELVRGLVFANKASHVAGAPTRVNNAKVGLIQFCLSAPKTDIENQVVVSEYSAMDRILREERKYILDLCKAVQRSGCNVLLVQKSILRDATNGATSSRAPRNARERIPLLLHKCALPTSYHLSATTSAQICRCISLRR